MSKKEDVAIVTVIAPWGLSILAAFAVPVGLIWAGIHFVRKFW